jgi:hypothetical protein
MTTESYIGSNPAAVLDQLTTAMGVENRLGTLEDARVGAPPRVTWVPPRSGGIGTERAPFALPTEDVTELQTQGFVVHLFAASYTDLLAMHASLAAQLDILIGPKMGQLPTIATDGVARPGYAFGKPADVGPVQNAAVAGAWACTVPATLKDFIARRVLTTTTPITSTPVTVVTTDENGQNQQAALP